MLITTKTPEYILSELTLSGKNRVHLLLEGEFDLNFWKNKINPDINIIYCGGKETIKKVIHKNTEFKIIAILDQDYCLFKKETARHSNIIYTDYNDLETTLLSLGIIDNLIDSYCNKEKICDNGINCNDIKSILNEAFIMGQLRYIDSMKDLHAPFESKLSIGKYYNNGRFEKEKLYQDFCQHTNISREDLEEQITNIPKCNVWLLLQGHDCIKVLNRFIIKYKSTSYPRKFDTADILTPLVGNKYKETTMVHDIQEWGRKNNIIIIRSSNS